MVIKLSPKRYFNAPFSYILWSFLQIYSDIIQGTFLNFPLSNSFLFIQTIRGWFFCQDTFILCSVVNTEVKIQINTTTFTIVQDGQGSESFISNALLILSLLLSDIHYYGGHCCAKDNLFKLSLQRNLWFEYRSETEMKTNKEQQLTFFYVERNRFPVEVAVSSKSNNITYYLLQRMLSLITHLITCLITSIK